jgi:hypothetical protein
MRNLIFPLFRVARSSLRRASNHGTPSLPAELWISILTEVIRPELLLEDSFKPFQIDAYHATLADDKGTSLNAGALITQRKRGLRSVCRTWRDIVDSIQGYWVIDFCNAGHSTQEPLQLRFEECERLNVLYYTTIYPQVKFQYSHPVTTLTLHVSSDVSQSQSGTLASLIDILSYPRELRVLHLYFSVCNAP